MRRRVFVAVLAALGELALVASAALTDPRLALAAVGLVALYEAREAAR